MHFAVGEGERESDEVGGALLAQILEHREIEAARPDGAAHFSMALENQAHWALQVKRAVAEGVRRFHDLDRFAITDPDEGPPKHVGMERAHEHRHAVELELSLEKPPAKVQEHIGGRLGRRRAAVEPVDDRLDVQRLESHRLDSIAPGSRGRRARMAGSSAVFSASGLENSAA